jgi:predicted NBD/HSP70 family sugar kinase
MRKAIGIDLGRSPMIGVLIDINGNLIDKYVLDTPLDTPFVYSAQDIKKLIKKLHKADVTGICLGTPGRIDPIHGICHFSPNFPYWKEVDMTGPFSEEFRLPAFAINDVNGAALGEMYYGAGTLQIDGETPTFLTLKEGILFDPGGEKRKADIKSLVLIAVGVGVGSGIIINNELVAGKNYGAGELGHVTIESAGPACSCGNRGCLESLCSLNAIRRDIAKSLEKERDSLITEYITSPEQVTFKILEKCARKKDRFILKVLEVAGRNLAVGIAAVANILDPEMIVLGGDIVPLLDILHPVIMSELKERIRLIPFKDLKIGQAQLGELAGAYGAAAYVFKRLFSL